MENTPITVEVKFGRVQNGGRTYKEGETFLVEDKSKLKSLFLDGQLLEIIVVPDELLEDDNQEEPETEEDEPLEDAQEETSIEKEVLNDTTEEEPNQSKKSGRKR